MKTMLKITFVLALVAAANTLFAVGNLKVNMVALKDVKAVVAISALSNSNFNITISDEKGQIVYYQENTDHSDIYRKVYNFSNLEDGFYKISVVSDDLTTERQFQKIRSSIRVGDEKTTLEPFFKYEDGLFRCSYLNFDKENVVLHFYGNDQEIFKKNIGKDFSIQQVFSLSKLKRGNYSAVLTAGNKVFSYNIEVE